MNFHFSFSSRFSRFWKQKQKNFSFSSRFTRFLYWTSLSPLDFQDFVEQFLFLLSIFKNLEKISPSFLDFQDFLNQHFDNWSLSMIYQNMLVSLYHLTTFTQLPDWFLTLSWHCVRQRLQKGKVLTTLIFCLLESLIYLPISLSLLETGQRNSRFLFLLSKLEKGIQVSLSPLETGQENSRFLFLLSRRGKGIQISPSPLECGEIVFKFLFLFSIGLFCISSMTDMEGTWEVKWSHIKY